MPPCLQWSWDPCWLLLGGWSSSRGCFGVEGSTSDTFGCISPKSCVRSTSCPTIMSQSGSEDLQGLWEGEALHRLSQTCQQARSLACCVQDLHGPASTESAPLIAACACGESLLWSQHAVIRATLERSCWNNLRSASVLNPIL